MYNTMLYKYPGTVDLNGKAFSITIVDEDIPEALSTALSDGWSKTQDEAYDAYNTALNAPDAAIEDAPPTREELEIKAKELGISFTAKTTDVALLKLINSKVAGEV